jgi:5-methylcytosine-specific restriction endonuclease McrA
MSTRRFTGDYAPDGKAKRLKVREEAGHRCIRCGHPFQSGKHGKGEWSPCDEQCTHGGPIRWDDNEVRSEAQWRILTVHHLDGDKANDAWWNTLALCQRCHLAVQTKVDPEIPWMLEHSEWFRPYVAGFYAKKYEGRDITREEAMQRLDALLAYELKAR